MSGYAKFERPQLVRAASGLAYYESAAFVQDIEDVYNASTTVTIERGMAVIIDNANCVFPTWGYSTAGTDVTFATKCVLAGAPSTAASGAGGINFLGVALENIAPGQTGRVCTGGLCAVKCGTATMVLSQFAIGTTVAGVVGPSATAAVGITLGQVYAIRGTSAGQSGNANECIVRISPA